MSLVVSPYPGKKRLFEEESYEQNSHQPLSAAAKRQRFVSSPSGRCTPLSAAHAAAHFSGAPTGLHPATLNALRALFPGMEDQVVTNVLTECGDDIDAAIRRLTELRLSSEQQAANANGAAAGPSNGAGTSAAAASSAANGRPAHMANGAPQQQQQQQQQPPPSGPQTADQWTDALVGEMSAAKDVPDARSRAAKLLHAFEQFVTGRIKASSDAGGDAAVLQRENTILKKAVQIQNARMQESAAREQEMGALKQLLGQYQERLRNLEMSNYSLALHLSKATDSGRGSLPSHRPPDVF